MKRFGILLGSILLGVGVITTSAFAYFNFSENSTTSNNANTDDNYVNNIKFDNTTTIDRTFNLYFFASPYYATGNPSNDSTTNTITWSEAKDQDPLTICELGEDNPYNDSTDYTLGGQACDSEYGNVTFNDGNSHYYCLPDDALDTSKLNSSGQLTGQYDSIINYYQTRDFSGYITLYNSGNTGQRGTGITDSDGNSVDINDGKIYSYYKLTVTGGIKADTLKNIIPSSVFKDRYGFGPEFMGWTYNKEECFERVAYESSTDSSSYSRYFKASSSDNQNIRMYHFDSRGYGVGEDTNLAYQIGNYGDNTKISILSADDSLIYINSLGVDGSSANDNNIYLYPVFGSKNGIKHTSGDQSPILKMRTNPITDTTSADYYKYHQIGEIDYDNDLERFTSYFNYIPDADVDNGEPNYTIKNFHVDQSQDDDGNYINNYQLDVNFTTTDNSWAESWGTLINSSTLAASIDFYDDYFKTYGGYFDIDIIFTQSSTCSFTSLKNPENYINDVTRINQTTITVDGNSYSVSYIIGIKRDNTLKITGLYDSNAIFWYDNSSKANSYLYKSSVTHTDDSNSIWYYFTSNSIELKENQNISTMVQNALSIKDDHDINTFTYMSDELLKTYNDKLTSSSFIENKTKYKTTDSSSKLVSGRGSITGYDPDNYPSTTEIENFPYINATEKGTYELLIAVNYKEGFPYNFEVAYREIATDNVLLVLDTKPQETENGYLYSEIYENYSDNIVCEGTFQNNTVITTSTEFTNGKTITISEGTSIIDLATGIDVTSLINNGKFYSTRNMILYYKTNS